MYLLILQFFMCNAWAAIIVSFLKTYFLYTNTLLIWMISFNEFFNGTFNSKRIQLKNILIYHVCNLYVTIAADKVVDRWAALYCFFIYFQVSCLWISVYFSFYSERCRRQNTRQMIAISYIPEKQNSISVYFLVVYWQSCSFFNKGYREVRHTQFFWLVRWLSIL